MNAEKVPCRNPECRKPILPATAKANDGLCAPCIAVIRKAERDEYVRKNRRTIDLYAGVTDPVDAICIILTTRNHDPLIKYLPAPKTVEEFFGELTEVQAQRLAGIAAEAMKSGNEDFAEEISRSLATLNRLNLDAMLHVWLDANHLWPSVAFRGAGAGVRDRILGTVSDGTANLNHALSALAWIGDEVVQQQFSEWEMHPKPWRQHLFVGPASYAETGGWELLNGTRRNLFYDECLALIITETAGAASPIRLLTETTEACPHCGDVLVHLLEIPTSDVDFGFLNFHGLTLPVLTCERCACFAGPVFANIRPDGRPEWHTANRKPQYFGGPDFKWERGPWQGVTVITRPRTAIHAVDSCMDLPATQIGGMPTWVQDSEYPKCPDCSRKMTFLAQLDNGQFRGHEGTYYAFWCSDCRNTATSYQQT